MPKSNHDLSRGGSRGGRSRGDQFGGGGGGVGPDGWSVPVATAPPLRRSTAGDCKFYFSRLENMTFEDKTKG